MKSPPVDLTPEIRSADGLHRWEFHAGVFDLAMASP
jgi:hypothetical protein